MPPSPIAEKIKPAMAFLLAWAFLNILMNVKYPAQQIHVLTLFTVTPEVLGIIMIPLAATCMGVRFHPALYVPLTMVVLFLRLFRTADILVPMFFFRPFNLFLDAQFVPDLIHLLYTTFSMKHFVFVAVLGMILLAGVTIGIWLSFKTIHNFLAHHRNRRAVIGLIAAGLILLSLLPHDGIRIPGEFLAKGFFHRVVEEFNLFFILKAIVTGNALSLKAR